MAILALSLVYVAGKVNWVRRLDYYVEESEGMKVTKEIVRTKNMNKKEYFQPSTTA